MERTRTSAENMIRAYIIGSPNAMYDIGVGIYSEWETLKNAYPSMEVFGCEPCPEEYAVLKPIFNGKLLQVGVAETAGKRQLHVSDVGTGFLKTS